MTNSLSKLTTHELVKRFDRLILQEREATSQVILHLAEIDRRKIYAIEGYSSLFNYCVEKYHYSESAAYRRIQVARLSSQFPDVIQYLKEGKIRLINLCLITPYLNHENKREILSHIVHKSSREVEGFISFHFGKPEAAKDKIRVLPHRKFEIPATHESTETAQIFTSGAGGEKIGRNDKRDSQDLEQIGHSEVSQKESQNPLTGSGFLSDTDRLTEEPVRNNQVPKSVKRRVKIEFQADEEVAELIQRAKEVLRHKYPQGKLEDLVREAFELLLQKKDPERKFKKDGDLTENDLVGNKTTNHGEITNSSQTDQNNRYIPRNITQQIWERDRGRCCYKSPQGKQCSEKGGLELDHIEPWALGGKSNVDNLRLLCHTHNQLRAKQTFASGHHHG